MRRHARWWGAFALVAALAAGCALTDETGGRAPRSDQTSTTADDPVDLGGPEAPARPSAGCADSGGADSGGADGGGGQATAERVEIVVGGLSRHYLITTPAPSGEPLPLVVDLHGLMEGAEIHSRHSNLGEFGLERGFVTVFPHATGDPISWNAGETGEDNADLRYLDAVLDRVTSRRCVDESRIYATGLSNGAMMASLLACTRSERFAAVAPVGGVTAPEPCEQQRPVPILATHGTADPILRFNGGVGDLSGLLAEEDGSSTTESTTTAPADLDGEGYPATVATWADRNGCEPDPDDERLTESVLHRTYDCPPGAEVEFYAVEGGGHTWPGSDFGTTIESIVGPTTFDIDWNELLWEFFGRFSNP